MSEKEQAAIKKKIGELHDAGMLTVGQSTKLMKRLEENTANIEEGNENEIKGSKLFESQKKIRKDIQSDIGDLKDLKSELKDAKKDNESLKNVSSIENEITKVKNKIQRKKEELDEVKRIEAAEAKNTKPKPKPKPEPESEAKSEPEQQEEPEPPQETEQQGAKPYTDSEAYLKKQHEDIKAAESNHEDPNFNSTIAPEEGGYAEELRIADEAGESVNELRANMNLRDGQRAGRELTKEEQDNLFC